MLIFQPVVFVDPWRANRLTPTLRKAKHTNGAEHPKRQILNNHVLQPVMGPKAEELGNPIQKVGRDFIEMFFLILIEISIKWIIF